MDGLCFCGVREQIGNGTRQYKLPTIDPTWFFDGQIAGIDEADVRDCIQRALSSWSKGCAVHWHPASHAEAATLRIITTNIDGPGNVLADCQLPYPGMRQLLMRLDAEKFTLAINPPQRMIGLQHVVAHEGGHAMGFFHIAYDDSPDLMNPTYRRDIYEPQADDIALARTAYGPARPVKPTTPAAPAPAADKLVVEELRIAVGGQRYKLSGQVGPMQLVAEP